MQFEGHAHLEGKPRVRRLLGYKALFLESGISEVGCMAHARRKFAKLHLANKSTLAAAAIELIGRLYGIEREVEGPGGRRSLARTTNARGAGGAGPAQVVAGVPAEGP
ncbi:MAG TPA: transposase [Roseateles sp.]